MTELKKYIRWTRHTIPTLWELHTRLNGAKYFTYLDMNDMLPAAGTGKLAAKSRKQKAYHILDTLWAQAFQEITLWGQWHSRNIQGRSA